MCVSAQSNNGECVHYPRVDLQTERVTIVKLREINQDMASRHARAVVHDPARIQGGNWKMQGFRRSGHVHDEAECQMSIAEFMAEQKLQQDRYDG
jgi:hypothetical protein